MDIYTKTRNLLRHPEQDFIAFAFKTFSDTISPTIIPHDKVNGLAIQLKTVRAIRRTLNIAILILQPKNIIFKEHPPRFYRSVFGKMLLCLFQPLLRFRKLLLNFEVFVYIGYLGKISGDCFNLFEPHPDFLKKFVHIRDSNAERTALSNA